MAGGRPGVESTVLSLKNGELRRAKGELGNALFPPTTPYSVVSISLVSFRALPFPQNGTISSIPWNGRTFQNKQFKKKKETNWTSLKMTERPRYCTKRLEMYCYKIFRCNWFSNTHLFLCSSFYQVPA